eukprot:356030-Chlamydomonas_euryale.AAC.2
MLHAHNTPCDLGPAEVVNRQVGAPLVLVRNKRKAARLAARLVTHQVEVDDLAVLTEDRKHVALGQTKVEAASKHIRASQLDLTACGLPVAWVRDRPGRPGVGGDRIYSAGLLGPQLWLMVQSCHGPGKGGWEERGEGEGGRRGGAPCEFEDKPLHRAGGRCTSMHACIPADPSPCSADGPANAARPGIPSAPDRRATEIVPALPSQGACSALEDAVNPVTSPPVDATDHTHWVFLI